LALSTLTCCCILCSICLFNPINSSAYTPRSVTVIGQRIEGKSHQLNEVFGMKNGSTMTAMTRAATDPLAMRAARGHTSDELMCVMDVLHSWLDR
jgi:hypothetical protein